MLKYSKISVWSNISNLQFNFWNLDLSDADDCRRICEHGAKKLGYGSYQHYILSNYDLSDDSGSDSGY